MMCMSNCVDGKDVKFLKTKPRPIYHIKKAEKAIGSSIINHRALCGTDLKEYNSLCEAQLEINLALKDLEKMGVKE